MSVIAIADMISPLARPAYVMRFRAPVRQCGPLLSSHFGGMPYLEFGEKWPSCCGCGGTLDFICQFDLSGINDLVLRGRLAVFYCCLSCRCSPPGWELRVYMEPSIQRARDRTEGIATKDAKRGRVRLRKGRCVTPCGVVLLRELSLPDWVGVEPWCKEAVKASCQLALGGKPSSAYWQAVEMVIGSRSCKYSYLGGYPRWIQGDCTPLCDVCKKSMSQVFTIGSDEETNLNWTDLGAIYLFQCSEHPEERELVEQFL